MAQALDYHASLQYVKGVFETIDFNELLNFDFLYILFTALKFGADIWPNRTKSIILQTNIVYDLRMCHNFAQSQIGLRTLEGK